MKKLYFDYYMQIDYTEVVARCSFTIKCLPRDTARQRTDSVLIDLYPKSEFWQGVDGLGNIHIYGNNDVPHDTFYCHITGRAITGLSEFEEEADDGNAMIFRHPHGLNMPGETIKAYFEGLEPDFTGDTYWDALRIMNHLHQDFIYCSDSTSITTTAEEAFAQGRGVCQDYAHIFISLLHLAGITARYVTGFIVGEGASHAWVEILHNGKWIGLDPTHNMPVLEDHIKIGVGRDAADCMINRGIMHGGGFHTQTVKVNVYEL